MQGAIFVNQASRSGQIGPLAPWITTAGWAAAAEHRYGGAWIVTSEGVLRPSDVFALATRPARSADEIRAWRRRVPEPLVTAAKDARRVLKNREFWRSIDPTQWRTEEVRFVFQLHGLFCDAGMRLADVLRAPSVVLVDACQVEEARGWGVKRQGWARLAEVLGERPQLRKADLVVCVSEEVAASVARCAGRRSGVAVVPNGVDTDLFSPKSPDLQLRAQLGLETSFVVGWAGSFRSFHGLDTLLAATARARDDIHDVALLLVGDGLERPSIESRARELGIRAVFPGTVPYGMMPEYIRLMDVSVVLADHARSFHYSPVKLREFQACARPVVASNVGEMGRELIDGQSALLVSPGDAAALADAIRELYRDRGLASRIGDSARAAVVASGTWSSRIDEVERLLATTTPA